MEDYLRRSRHPTYGIVFALPLLALYELLAAAMNLGRQVEVRNAADVWTRGLLRLVGIDSTFAVSAALIAMGVMVVWRTQRVAPVALEGRVLGWMLAESCAWALAFGSVVGGLTAALLNGFPMGVALSVTTAETLQASLGRGELLVLSLGAGLYEELLFRVLLVPLVAGLLLATGRIGRNGAWGGAVLVSAVLFSLAHHVGPYGEPFAAAPLLFRFLAGLAFSLILVLRGFGIVTWTHALYDVFLALRF